MKLSKKPICYSRKKEGIFVRKADPLVRHTLHLSINFQASASYLVRPLVSASVENQEASKYHMTQVEIYHLFVFGLAIDHTPPVIECYKLQDVMRTVPNA